VLRGCRASFSNLPAAEGDRWTDDYNVKPIGVLECPTVVLEISKKPDDDESDKSDEHDWEIIGSMEDTQL